MSCILLGEIKEIMLLSSLIYCNFETLRDCQDYNRRIGENICCFIIMQFCIDLSQTVLCVVNDQTRSLLALILDMHVCYGTFLLLSMKSKFCIDQYITLEQPKFSFTRVFDL